MPRLIINVYETFMSCTYFQKTTETMAAIRSKTTAQVMISAVLWSDGFV